MATITKLHPTHSQLLQAGFQKVEWGSFNEFNYRSETLEIYVRYDHQMKAIEDLMVQDKVIDSDYFHLFTIPRFCIIISALDLTKEIVQ